MSKPYVNLHTHSAYSILRATAKPAQILEKAKSLDHPAVALTDTGNGHGLIEFCEAAAKIGDIKPIMGAEIFVSKDSHFERRNGIDGNEGYVVLIAKNQTGWENLLKILSIAQLEGLFQKPRIDLPNLEKHAEGIVCLTGGFEGELFRRKEVFGEGPAEEFLGELNRIFPQNCYLEMVSQPIESQKNANQYAYQCHQKTNIPLVISSNARYIEPDGDEANQTLYAIGEGFNLSENNRINSIEKSFFKDFTSIQIECSYIPEEVLETARQNTLEINTQIDLEIEFNRSLLPECETAPGETEATQLEKNCEAGFQKRFANHDNRPAGFDEKEYRERLAYELEIINSMGFAAYFLIVQDFIAFAKDSNIAVGPGRGSAAGSLVSFLLEITNIDPIEYELLFERFLNPERISMPDVDIDFSDERRDEVLQYVIQKYGTEKVSKVCTFGTLAAKAALKDVGRAYGVEYSQMNTLTKLLPNKPGFKLKESEEIGDFKALIDSQPSLKKTYELGLELEGSIRHVSVHACAVIIGPSDLSQFTPLQWAPGTETVKITQFPYQQLEHLGLLKMDFLGLKNLSILEKTIANIEQTTGKKIDLETIPIDDEKTFECFANGDTTGVFQFESAGMRRYLRELKPTEFEDLVAMNALYRPGPMEYIPQYIAGKHDPTTVKHIHPVLEKILKKTYGIAVYQEQILQIARDFGGFSLGGADILRKAIGKKIASILTEQRAKFIEGAIKNGHDKKMAEKIFDDIIVPFSGYGFNRSHAVCYARIAYETAYLRANYPVEFMAAMMTTDRNNTDRIVLEMNECQSMGIEVLPPSLNESGNVFTIIPENKEKIEKN